MIFDSKKLLTSFKILPTLRFLARTEIFFYSLIWLILLLIIGTIAQKEIGLFQAQQQYFSSYIFWFKNLLPLPSGRLIMAIITINLFCKLSIEQWEFAKLGIIITHIGALILLLGGFFTAYFSYEGNMVIPEGQTSNFLSDYHESELAIIDSQLKKDVVIFTETQLQTEHFLKSPLLPFEIQPVAFYQNTKLTRNKTAPENSHGMAKIFTLHPAPDDKINENNHAGFSFLINSDQPNINGLYALFVGAVIPQNLEIGQYKYLIELRYKRSYLPFAIELIDFKKTTYPGTNIAKEYQSEIIIHDTQTKWRNLIKMNHPLRYKGYSFFQSSFINGKTEITVLAVVKNIGRLFPYIASIIICIGLLIHLIQRRKS